MKRTIIALALMALLSITYAQMRAQNWVTGNRAINTNVTSNYVVSASNTLLIQTIVFQSDQDITYNIKGAKFLVKANVKEDIWPIAFNANDGILFAPTTTTNINWIWYQLTQ